MIFLLKEKCLNWNNMMQGSTMALSITPTSTEDNTTNWNLELCPKTTVNDFVVQLKKFLHYVKFVFYFNF